MRYLQVSRCAFESLSTPYSSLSAKQANLEKISEAKAGTIEEHFGRVKETLLQLQAFGEQTGLTVPETMTVDAYVEQNSGQLEPEPLDYEHSVW